MEQKVQNISTADNLLERFFIENLSKKVLTNKNISGNIYKFFRLNTGKKNLNL